MNDAQQSSLTIQEFCVAEHISKASLYDLLKRGLGPELFNIPGTRIRRITPQAREAWRDRMAQLAQAEAVQIEAERRRELAAVAGRIAARSPLHVSRQKRKKNRRPA
jgi:hypothetical protein